MSTNPPLPVTSHGEYITAPGFLGLPISFPTRNTISLRNSFLLSVFSYLELMHYVFVISQKRTRTLLLLRDFKYYNSRSDTFENDRHLCRYHERIRRDSYQNIIRKRQHSVYYVVKEEQTHEQPCSQALSSLSPLSLGKKPMVAAGHVTTESG